MEVPLEPNRNRIDSHESAADTQLTERLWMATLLLLVLPDLLCELPQRCLWRFRTQVGSGQIGSGNVGSGNGNVDPGNRRRAPNAADDTSESSCPSPQRRTVFPGIERAAGRLEQIVSRPAGLLFPGGIPARYGTTTQRAAVEPTAGTVRSVLISRSY